MDLIGSVIAIGLFVGCVYVFVKQWKKGGESSEQPGSGEGSGGGGRDVQDSYLMGQKNDVDKSE